ncbi:actin-like ATPase domain-containing protein [Exidia glandulosa HHB12029]|uniref:Actin-like ATPase domain-containing protein n=1 Tax=Exidia glandulosa HHB12029 TaxID=1314781 RepID=A0A165PM30_EXIGL|nr:actin-like ATPase domain-containing protein [Exidia glandulosa HHB12029]
MSAPYRYPTPEPPPAGFTVDDYDAFRGTSEPIVIDNGSSNLRFGFASANDPVSQQNIVSRYKDRRLPGTVLLFGDAVDIEATTRTQSRTPWEGDLLLNFDAMESALDYVFIKLGVDTGTVEHPIAITERICSPLHSRTLTSELLFELYNAPAVCYPIDALMSFHHNSPAPEDRDGLVLSFNTYSTSIIPVLDGRGILSQAKRMPWGAAHASDYMLKLVQLKHPTLPMRLTNQHSTWMMQNFCEFAPDYRELIRSLDDATAIQTADRIIQMPYAATVQTEKTEEEIARATEKRRETGRRLQEQLAKKRAEQLIEKEQDLAHLLEIKAQRPGLKKAEWINVLRKDGIDDDDELDEAIEALEIAVKKAKRKEAADLAAAAAAADDKEKDDPNAMNEEPTFPLLEMPDAELDEEQLKEKKKQRLLKAGYDARMRAKAEKERIKKEAEDAQKREDEERERDIDGWTARVRGEREALLVKIKERKRRRAAMSDRKSAAAQARMKNIASLAADAGPSKKRRKTNGEDKDTFGANDDDWSIYRKIQTGASSSDEEDDEIALLALETKLLAHDPAFTAADTHAAQTAARGALVAAVRPPGADARGHVHLSLERWRVPETWWSPSMAGADIAGLGELIQVVLSAFPVDERARLARRVFFTGGPAQLPGLDERLRQTLRPILPPEMELGVVKAFDPVLDAWRGMASFARSEEFKSACITKEEYEEYGGERIKKWWGGNWNGAL